MNIKELLIQNLKNALEALGVQGEFTIEIERPKDETHGDFSSNISMILAKTLKKNPLQIAQDITELLIKNSDSEFHNSVKKIEAVAPGFINFKISLESNKSIITKILEDKDEFGRSKTGEGKKVMIEFGQPNTHKAFHVGHLKSAISGLSIVRLHENLGYEVIKANYFGDVGMHVAKATWGFKIKGVPMEFETWDIHEKMRYIDDCYVLGSTQFKENPDAEKEIREINRQIYAKEDTQDVQTYRLLREISLKHQDDIWQSLGVSFDVQYPESDVFENAIKIVEENKGKVFEESEGAIIYRGEKEGLTNWVFLTGEGHPTYSAKDLALGAKKFEQYPDLFKAIITTSIEQVDYFKVVIKVLGILNPQTVGRYFHLPFGWMLRGGKKFSSRMGTSIKGMDILKEVKELSAQKVAEIEEYDESEKSSIASAVANAGLKFLILSHEFYKDFSYDPEQFLNFQGFSGPYLLYSYARAKSILRKSKESSVVDYTNVLNNQYEQSVLKQLAEYPEVAQLAGEQMHPHLICNYLYDLSQKFNQFYNNCPVLNAENDNDKSARLMLTEATAQVLKNGLTLLGIETVEKM
jgi:arginyl-tRNA synthetase